MASGCRSSELAKAARSDGYAKAETVECGVKCVGGSWWALSSGASQLAAWLEHGRKSVCSHAGLADCIRHGGSTVVAV